MSDEIIENGVETPTTETETKTETTTETQTEIPFVEETPTVQETTPEPEPVTETKTETTPAVIEQPVQTPAPVLQYVKIGQESKLRMRTLSTDERNAMAMDAATLSRQIKTKEAERNALIAQFNIQLQNIDKAIEQIKSTSRDKSDKAVVGEVTEQVLCDVYNTATETLFVAAGKDVTQADNIIIRRDRTEAKEPTTL